MKSLDWHGLFTNPRLPFNKGNQVFQLEQSNVDLTLKYFIKFLKTKILKLMQTSDTLKAYFSEFIDLYFVILQEKKERINEILL